MSSVRSYWRKAHYILALLSLVFLIITSVTGVILSFEPVSNRLHAAHVGNAKDNSLGALIEQLESTYMEVMELKIDENRLLQVSVIDDEGEFLTFLADPNSGKKVEKSKEEHPVFSFSRTLHRSLFYGSIGRLIIGITSFLLFFIAITGVVLIAQRQLGWRKFFSKVNKDNTYTYWHIVTGRWSLPLLVIISLTGAFLSLERFELFPEEQEVKHAIDFDTMTDTPVLKKRNFELFKSTPLEDVESIQFPFSPDIEDYYHIRLRDRELIVNQFNGSIISEVEFSKTSQWQQLAFNLHTGKASAIWSVVLGIASLSVLFFIFSGLKIALRRRRKPKKNCFSKNDARIIILVGSEGGETMLKAQQLQVSLIKAGESVFLDRLNNYQIYESIEHLLIFTSTYGDGQAPMSASNFLEKFPTISQTRNFTFSVVGFGSKSYLQFCKFAKDVSASLNEFHLKELLPVALINNQSVDALNLWLSQWSAAMKLSVDPFMEKSSETKRDTFVVLEKSVNNPQAGESFQLALRSMQNLEFQSGDLIAVQPPSDARERFYSIGLNKRGELLLSIKLHEQGVCSHQLGQYSEGDKFEARIQRNESFHFPKEASKIICISNGTGIAPFIGMANENIDKKRMDVYWGSRFSQDLKMYQDEIDHAQELGQLASFQYTLSREGDEKYKYVQDLVRGDGKTIVNSLEQGAVIMICGSIAMRDDVLRLLNQLCTDSLNTPLEYFVGKGQILSDCY